GALLDLGRDHKNLGAQLGLLALLQTWTRDLRFHPHVHCVVPAGGLSADGLRWVAPKDPAYFLPQQALPQGFQRVRSFGWLSAAARTKWERILALLDWTPPALTPPAPLPPPLCPCCHQPMKLVALLARPPPL